MDQIENTAESHFAAASPEMPVSVWVRRAISWAAGWREVLMVAAKLHLLCCERRLSSLCLVIRGGKKNPKQKKALLLLPERSPSLVPCVEQVVDMVAFIVYGEKLNSSKWVILVCFNFVNSLPTQYPKSISSHWQKVSQFCAWWIEFQYILQKFPFCKDCVVVFKWMGGFKKSWRLSKKNEIC